jgi:hypothetical protein
MKTLHDLAHPIGPHPEERPAEDWSFYGENLTYLQSVGFGYDLDPCRYGACPSCGLIRGDE